MTKQELIEIIRLLSALEGWSFANNHRLPDYLFESIDKAVKRISEEVLK